MENRAVKTEGSDYLDRKWKYGKYPARCLYIRSDASAHRLSVAFSQHPDSGDDRDREKLISQLDIESTLCAECPWPCFIWQIEIHIGRPFSWFIRQRRPATKRYSWALCGCSGCHGWTSSAQRLQSFKCRNKSSNFVVNNSLFIQSTFVLCSHLRIHRFWHCSSAFSRQRSKVKCFFPLLFTI